MLGLDSDIVEHHIPIYPNAKTVKHKLRKIKSSWPLQAKEEIRLGLARNQQGLPKKEAQQAHSLYQSAQQAHSLYQSAQQAQDHSSNQQGLHIEVIQRLISISHRRPRDLAETTLGLKLGLPKKEAQQEHSL